jgi:hypothetical protein
LERVAWTQNTGKNPDWRAVVQARPIWPDSVTRIPLASRVQPKPRGGVGRPG